MVTFHMMIHTCNIYRLSQLHITRHQQSVWHQAIKTPGDLLTKAQLKFNLTFKMWMHTSSSDVTVQLAGSARS